MRQEIATRRSLPHWYKPGAIFFVTYRLAGSLPVEVMERLRAQQQAFLKQPPAPGVSKQEHRDKAHKIWFRDYDAALDRVVHAARVQENQRTRAACATDANGSPRWLADRKVAAMVRGNLYHHHGTKYYLVAYSILSNHVHVVLQPTAEFEHEVQDQIGDQEDGRSPLSEIMHSLKSYTAHEANKLLNKDGSFWQRESYDHWIRSEEELERIVHYVQANPVEANLSERPEDHWWCSCHDRVLQDGEVTSWLGWK